MRGFTLLEVIMVVSMLAVIGAAGAATYSNYGRGITTAGAWYDIHSALTEARSKAIAGQDERRWGVRFLNADRDRYELFSTPTTYADAATIVERTGYLPGGVTFSDPAESGTRDILFSRIAGTTTPSSVTIAAATGSATVTVSAIGTVH